MLIGAAETATAGGDLERLHQLEPAGRYAPILTTGNGFCRYRLADEVECTGSFARTLAPLTPEERRVVAELVPRSP